MSTVFWSLAEIASGLEFRGTAYTPCAAQIDVTGLLDEVEVEMGDRDHGVVQRVIDMPLVTAAMQEDRYFRKGPVTINNIAIPESN
jgi:hypothetical protein